LQNKLGKHPIRRGIYAVNAGDYAGEFFVFMDVIEGRYNFLSLPKNECRHVPEDAFNRGVKQRIITFIQSLPNNVFEICKAQFDISLKTSGKVSRKRG
jgi:hypothetical protein